MSAHQVFLVFAMMLIGLPTTRADDKTAWPVPDWQIASPESEGISAAKLAELKTWLAEHGSKTGMVVRHGRIVAEWYFEDATAESQYLVYSTSKSFSSTAAGIAIAEGKFSLDDKLQDFVSDVAPEAKREITVRQILSMTTGVHNEPEVRNRTDMSTYALTLAPMDYGPGKKWEYNNTGLTLLGPIFRKATGQDIDAYLNAKVFEPIGIKRSDWQWDRQDGGALPFSGLHINARALARFGLMTLREGKWQEKQIVPADWVKQAAGSSQSINKGYGFLWWNNVENAWPGVPRDAFAAQGKFDNDMLIVPSLDLILIRQIGEDPQPNRKVNKAEMFRLAAEAVVK
jgi:CubicO group peptidase (beta-lactamase class C family)